MLSTGVKKIIFLVALLVLTASPAKATYIDLLSSSWAAAAGQTSYTYTNILPGLDLTVSATGGWGLLWWDPFDGLGVIGGANYDELDYGEGLTFSFSQPVTLNSFTLYDLYVELGVGKSLQAYSEKGYAVLDGTRTVPFQADSGQIYLGLDLPGGGMQVVTVSGSSNQVSDVQFFAKPDVGLRTNDYQVAGLDITPSMAVVPEPGTLILVSTGLGLGALMRRRRRTV